MLHLQSYVIKSLFLIFILAQSITMSAQHENHMTGNDTKQSQDTSGMDHMMNNNMPGMSHAFSLNLPMNRNGSGTGWLPDESPMYGFMYHSHNWMYMLHGNLFLRYNNQDFTGKGLRGDQEFDAPNWLMFMGQRKVGSKGLFHFSTMFSLDAVFGGDGYPLLFQTGESYNGEPLIDRQHPHDLFSELAVSYSYSFSQKTDLFFYLGYPGEPSLGPVAFMHRPSALYNPDAPLSHHWIDATHITFGVATIGIRLGEFKIEGSSFTGREPNEYRYDFDKPRFDSWSSRLSFNPSSNWALQVSHGFLKSPEELHPGENIFRTTASATFSKLITETSHLNAVLLWGINKSPDHDGENALMLESSWSRNKLAIHGRYEYVQKSAEELVLEETFEEAVFPVNAITLGFNYDILNIGKFMFAGGSQFTLFSSDSRLNNLYGNNPMAIEIFLRIFPSIMKM